LFLPARGVPPALIRRRGLRRKAAAGCRTPKRPAGAAMRSSASRIRLYYARAVGLALDVEGFPVEFAFDLVLEDIVVLVETGLEALELHPGIAFLDGLAHGEGHFLGRQFLLVFL